MDNLLSIRQRNSRADFELLVRSRKGIQHDGQGGMFVNYVTMCVGGINDIYEIAANYMYDVFHRAPHNYYRHGDGYETRIMHHDDVTIRKVIYPFLIIRPVSGAVMNDVIPFIHTGDDFHELAQAV